jgi:hypothetical protein
VLPIPNVRCLWRIFGLKGEEVAGGCRRMHNEELRNLYASPNVVRVIKSRRMRLALHIAQMGELRNAYCVSVGRPEGKRPLRRRRSDCRIILEWILGKYDGRLWAGFIWLRIGTSGGSL